MLFCIICGLRNLRHSLGQPISPERQNSFSSDLTTELEDLRKFSLNSLMVLLAVLTISGSKAMLPVVLVLLLYTISLRLTVNACFLHNHPTLSRFLHTIPLLGTFCMASVELVRDMKSPALAVIILLLSGLPFITTIIHHHHHERCDDMPLPIRMQVLPSV
ncbi:hypothetical protein EV363DRAFT_1435255 [Boletus edulis]|uniref:Uncharacterized protein n=1 Tax=Boletus edulis BED1 TaxID=1328754 RepID=A0AAD4GFM0_BOLED|nr:hypothetical protein EV363DRAFT_1435255 [Boletus edulis]KAF8442166.1 hypothetical protein L210DRAFT_3535940 [Boletus edulis BED1]